MQKLPPSSSAPPSSTKSNVSIPKAASKSSMCARAPIDTPDSEKPLFNRNGELALSKPLHSLVIKSLIAQPNGLDSFTKYRLSSHTCNKLVLEFFLSLLENKILFQGEKYTFDTMLKEANFTPQKLVQLAIFLNKVLPQQDIISYLPSIETHLKAKFSDPDSLELRALRVITKALDPAENLEEDLFITFLESDPDFSTLNKTTTILLGLYFLQSATEASLSHQNPIVRLGGYYFIAYTIRHARISAEQISRLVKLITEAQLHDEHLNVRTNVYAFLARAIQTRYVPEEQIVRLLGLISTERLHDEHLNVRSNAYVFLGLAARTGHVPAADIVRIILHLAQNQLYDEHSELHKNVFYFLREATKTGHVPAADIVQLIGLTTKARLDDEDPEVCSNVYSFLIRAIETSHVPKAGIVRLVGLIPEARLYDEVAEVRCNLCGFLAAATETGHVPEADIVRLVGLITEAQLHDKHPGVRNNLFKFLRAATALGHTPAADLLQLKCAKPN